MIQQCRKFRKCKTRHKKVEYQHSLCETNQKYNVDFISKDHRIIYTGEEKNEKGVRLIIDEDKRK